MFEPIAARFVLVDTEGWFWIRTASCHHDTPGQHKQLTTTRTRASLGA
jgi:hypothetical protein